MTTIQIQQDIQNGAITGRPDPSKNTAMNGVTEKPRHILTACNVSWSVKTWNGSWYTCGCCKRTPKPVLNRLNATVHSGQIVAFLGNSGSGKTSFLNIIANRQSGILEGDIQYDGQKMTRDLFRKKGAYVIQADRLLTSLTVRETLWYTTRFIFAGNLNSKLVDAKVKKSLHQMSLRHVSESPVGGTGISGGERRRLSVAIQLLEDPDLILLDEPTTGLDSFTSHYLMETLATLAHRDQKMVVLTIHQPRSDIFRLLDTVGILSDGEMVYFGPQKELVPYFTNLGYPCPIYANPLDFYIDLSSIDRRSASSETKSADHVKRLVSSYRESSLFLTLSKELMSQLDTDNNPNRNEQKVTENQPWTDNGLHVAVSMDNAQEYNQFKSRPVQRFFVLIGTNIMRLFVHLWRNKVLFLGRALNMPTFAFFIWMSLWHLQLNLKSIQDRIGLFYQILAVSAQCGVLTATQSFPVLRNVYFRESGDGLYNCVHFLVAFYIHCIPLHLTSSALYTTWIFWGVGMNFTDISRFFKVCAVVFLQHHIGELQTVGCLILFSDPLIGQALSTGMVTMSMFYATGFLRSYQNMFPALRYLGYINHFKYAAEIVAANELGGLEFSCKEIAPNCTQSGDVVVEGMMPGAGGNMILNFGVLGAMVIIYWIVVILLLLARGRKVLH